MLALFFVGLNVGFQIRGGLDRRLIESYKEVVAACKAHLDEEEGVIKQQRDYQKFQERRQKRPLTWT